MTEVFIINTEKRDKGVSINECGSWFQLPVEDVDEILKAIDVEGNAAGRGYTISACHTDIPDFKVDYINAIGLDELNYILTTYEGLDANEQNIIKAILDSGEESELKQALEVMDRYSLVESVTDKGSAGQYMIGQREGVPEWLNFYIDYEKYYDDCEVSRECILTNFGLLIMLCN